MVLLYIPIIVFWVMVCYLDLKKWKRREMCTLKICAEVIEIAIKMPWSDISLGYKSALKINYMEKEEILNLTLYGRLLRFGLREKIWIYINPQNFIFDSPYNDFIFDSPYNDFLKMLDIMVCATPPILLLMLYGAGV